MPQSVGESTTTSVSDDRAAIHVTPAKGAGVSAERENSSVSLQHLTRTNLDQVFVVYTTFSVIIYEDN